MSNSTLERRYRRLMLLYPRSYRREREQEILAVLTQGARDGQRWPAWGEAGALLRGGITARLLQSFAWELKHRAWMAPVRALSGLWLVFITTILCAYGRWWGLVLLPFAVLHLYLFRWLVVGREPPQSSPNGHTISPAR